MHHDRENVPPPDEILLQHLEWIRRLARRMVADDQTAEDLAQETCVVALEHRPREGARVREWLATVMRNALRQRRRGDARRSAREVRIARPDASGEPTAHLVERVALERELVGAVLELDEPFRGAILLRFFEDLPPRAIAERLDVPVNTVNSRIVRGLERLRARLDRAHGDRASWALAFVPLLQRPDAGALVAGGILVNAKLALTLVSVLAVAAVVAVFALKTPSHEPGDVARASDRPIVKEPPVELASEVGVAGPRASMDEAPSSASTPSSSAAKSAESSAARVVRGRVLDADGGPLPGVRVQVAGAPASATSGADSRSATSGPGGWFELAATVAQGEIACADERWLTIRAGAFGSTRGAATAVTPLVIVGPWIGVAGGVVDEHGAGVAGAQLSLVLPDGFGARFSDSLEATHVIGWDARSRADGRFDLARVPSVAGASLRVLADGYERLSVELPPATTRDLSLVLARPAEPLTGALRGHVLDPRGAPVAGARVAAGLTSIVTDERGAFTIDLGRAVTAESVSAIAAGFLPVRLDRPRVATGTTTGWPDEIELVLGAQPLSLRARVVDAKGDPCPGLRVWIDDPTPFCVVGRVPFTQEGLLAGHDVPAQALATEPRAGTKDGDSYWDWRSTGAPPTAFWPWTKTGEDGWFEIGGLADRRYRVVVLDEKTLARHVSDPIRAGDRDAKIVLPAASMWPVVSGVVRSDAGAPLEGVEVKLETIAYGTKARVLGGRSEFFMMQPRESVTTDAQGRFELHDVPRVGPRLRFASDRIVPDEHVLAEGGPVTDLDVRVFTRCSVQVELSPPRTRADAIGFADAGGRGLDVFVISSGHVNAYTDVDLADGRSEVVSVSSAARTLVLLKGGEPVERVAIQLTPDGVNRLTP